MSRIDCLLTSLHDHLPVWLSLHRPQMTDSGGYGLLGDRLQISAKKVRPCDHRRTQAGFIGRTFGNNRLIINQTMAIFWLYKYKLRHWENEQTLDAKNDADDGEIPSISTYPICIYLVLNAGLRVWSHH